MHIMHWRPSRYFTTRGWTTNEHNLQLLEGDSYQELSVLLGGSVTEGAIHRY